MGQLTYCGSTTYEIEDRKLYHLRAAAVPKLRRGEGFMLSWTVDADYGTGRVALWLTESIPLEFRFAGSRVPPLNHEWIEAMTEMANSAHGLLLLDEDAAVRSLRARTPVRT